MNLVTFSNFINNAFNNAFSNAFSNAILNSIPQRDTYKPENWEVGDYIMCDSSVEGQFVRGDIHKIVALDLRPNFMNVKTLDSEGKENGWGVEYFRFHAVNHENILA